MMVQLTTKVSTDQFIGSWLCCCYRQQDVTYRVWWPM